MYRSFLEVWEETSWKVSSFSSAIMRVVGWRELELDDVSCYSAVDSVDSVGGGGGGDSVQERIFVDQARSGQIGLRSIRGGSVDSPKCNKRSKARRDCNETEG